MMTDIFKVGVAEAETIYYIRDGRYYELCEDGIAYILWTNKPKDKFYLPKDFFFLKKGI